MYVAKHHPSAHKYIQLYNFMETISFSDRGIILWNSVHIPYDDISSACT